MAKKSSTGAGSSQVLTITAPNLLTASVRLVGTSPFVQARFSQKAMLAMREKHEAGSTAKKKREPRDFEADFEAAKHVATEGWCGVPAGAFRNALISACRLVGYPMTKAKLSIFVEADGFDRVDGVPLVRLQSKSEPEKVELAVRNETGVADLRVRPMWREWEIMLRVRWDADQFKVEEVVNLLLRAGAQVGIGEGRHDSKKSAGLGWGCFRVDTESIEVS